MHVQLDQRLHFFKVYKADPAAVLRMSAAAARHSYHLIHNSSSCFISRHYVIMVKGLNHHSSLIARRHSSLVARSNNRFFFIQAVMYKN